MYRWEIINLIAGKLGAKTYLEIGVQSGLNLGHVQVPEKVGVDPDLRAGHATHHMHSDAFFEGLDPERRFDLVFVDGLHHSDQVVRDAQNALKHLSPGGVVVLHDCDPPNELASQREMCPGVWCGDVWKGWLELRGTLGREMFVVDTDLGCGVILPTPAEPVEIPKPWTWARLQAEREGWLGLVSVDEARARLEKLEPLSAAGSGRRSRRRPS